MYIALKILRRLLFGVIGLLLLFGWLVLQSSLFSDLRKGAVEKALTDSFDQPVVIKGAVKVRLFPSVRFVVQALSIPGGLGPSAPFVEVPEIELDLDTIALRKRQISFSKIWADQITVRIATLPGEKKSWRTGGPKSRISGRILDHEIVEFLLKRNVEFSDFRLIIDGYESGIELDVNLDELFFNYSEATNLSVVSGEGHVNGLPLTIQGRYPDDRGYTNFQAGSLLGEFSAKLLPDGIEGYEGKLSLASDNFHDLFSLLKLETNLDGSGEFSARLVRKANILSLSDISSLVRFEGGSDVSVAGGIENLLSVRGIDLAIDANFEGIALPIPFDGIDETHSVTSFETKVVGNAERIELKKVEIEIDSSERGLQRLGPFTVGNLERTNSGKVRLSDVAYRYRSDLGSKLSITGEIRDVLNLKSYKVRAQGSYSAQEFLTRWTDLKPEYLGFVDFDLALSDIDGHPSIEHLRIASPATSKWSLNVEASADNLLDINEASYSVSLSSDDPGELLNATGVQDTTLEAVSLSSYGSLGSDKSELFVEAQVGGSDFVVRLNGSTREGKPFVNGSANSLVLKMAEVKQFTSLIARLVGPHNVPNNDQEFDGLEADPLVVVPGEGQMQLPGMPKVQPLVLPDTGVLPARYLAHILKILKKVELGISVDLERLQGVPFLSSVNSKIKLQNGKLSIDPVGVRLGKANSQIHIEVDLRDRYDLVRVTGSANGWPLGDLINQPEKGITASGKLSANFDLVGKYDSVDAFLNSAAGSAHFFLRNGKITSSMLDLAGLGVLSWFFSKEMAQGFSEITCISAPLSVGKGVVRSNAITLETKKIQMVLKGSADLRKGWVNFEGEPRPIGLPNAPSPYPIKITGKFSEPDISVLPPKPRVGRDSPSIPNRKPCVPDFRQVSIAN